jgi:hypothetical protein
MHLVKLKKKIHSLALLLDSGETALGFVEVFDVTTTVGLK